jgi:hypothetical protein
MKSEMSSASSSQSMPRIKWKWLDTKQNARMRILA